MIKAYKLVGAATKSHRILWNSIPIVVWCVNGSIKMELEGVFKEWDELSNEFKSLEVIFEWIFVCPSIQVNWIQLIVIFFKFFFSGQETSNEYSDLLEKLHQYQQKCMNGIKHHRYRVAQINSNLKKFVFFQKFGSSPHELAAYSPRNPHVDDTFA